MHRSRRSARASASRARRSPRRSRYPAARRAAPHLASAVGKPPATILSMIPSPWRATVSVRNDAAKSRERNSEGRPASSSWPSGSKRRIAIRPASESESCGRSSRFDDPVSRNRPGRRSRSIDALRLVNRYGTRCTSSRIDFGGRLATNAVGSDSADRRVSSSSKVKLVYPRRRPTRFASVVFPDCRGPCRSTTGLSARAACTSGNIERGWMDAWGMRHGDLRRSGQTKGDGAAERKVDIRPTERHVIGQMKGAGIEPGRDIRRRAAQR